MSEQPWPHFRAHARRSVTFAGTLADPERAWTRPVRVTDLGLGGARVEAADSVPENVPLELLIEAPHLWDPLALTARIAWTRTGIGGSCVVGVSFQQPSGASLRTLSELLTEASFR